MARMSRADAAEAVTAVISGAGGTVNHEQLVNGLESVNKGTALEHVVNLTADGTIKAQVVATAPGTNELRYSLGGA